MILQALTDYYRTLEQKGKIAPPGWSESKVSFALYIDTLGSLEQVVSLQTEQSKGKKKVLTPQSMRLPAPVKRSSGIASNFLCDNSSYLLGVDSKGKPQRSVDCFQACAALHEQILADVDTPAARAHCWPFSAHGSPAKQPRIPHSRSIGMKSCQAVIWSSGMAARIYTTIRRSGWPGNGTIAVQQTVMRLKWSAWSPEKKVRWRAFTPP